MKNFYARNNKKNAGNTCNYDDDDDDALSS